MGSKHTNGRSPLPPEPPAGPGGRSGTAGGPRAVAHRLWSGRPLVLCDSTKTAPGHAKQVQFQGRPQAEATFVCSDATVRLRQPSARCWSSWTSPQLVLRLRGARAEGAHGKPWTGRPLMWRPRQVSASTESPRVRMHVDFQVVGAAGRWWGALPGWGALLESTKSC